MFEQGPQTISTDSALHPLFVNHLPKQMGSRTRKDGFQASLPFGSYLCTTGPWEWRPGWEGVGLPDSRHLCYPGHRCVQAGLCTAGA